MKVLILKSVKSCRLIEVVIDLFVFSLEVLVSSNDPLFSEEGGSKIDIDCQVHNLLLGNILGVCVVGVPLS